jgi:hypothetical protein
MPRIGTPTAPVTEKVTCPAAEAAYPVFRLPLLVVITIVLKNRAG